VRSAGRIRAVEAVCSHEDKGLEGGCAAGEGEWECPHHGARFDLATGRATGMPAVAPIRTYPVRVVDGRVQVDVE
jgi:nitrite reductase/ring-hydroxylating ferredoxin subunit